VRERLRSEGVVLVPALAGVALLVYWAAHGGGYSPSTWEPSALVVLGLLVATVAGLGPGRLRPSRPIVAALGALTAFVAWSYLSIAWAASPGDALEGSDRALLFLLLFALFALLPWRPWSALVALCAYALGIGTIAVVTLARLGDAAQVPGMFSGARLDTPVGYVNGSAALLLTGAVLSIALAARRELPVALRGLLLALAAAGLQASVLCESRGWLFALPIVALLAVVVVPGRVRLALWALPPLAGAALALPALLDVFKRADAAPTFVATQSALIAAAGHAANVALAVCAGVLVAGLGLALLDRRVKISRQVARRADRAGAGVAIAAVLVAVAAGLVLTHGRPDRKIADYWNRSSAYQAFTPGTSRFAAVGSNRPDFWRVSLRAFADHPLGGLGQDNWSAVYLRERRSGEQPRWTHSLELRLLAHTGIVGFLLFATFLIAALVAALGGRRRAGRAASATAAAAVLPLVVWLVHGSVDWFWEIPALSGPAFAFLGLGGALMRQLPENADAAHAAAPVVPRRVAALAAAGVLALAAAAALALPYLAERDMAAASSGWREDPAQAFAQLDRAASLNPLSSRPELLAGTIALELGDPRRAVSRFTAAIGRDGGDWFAWFGRGLATSEQGSRAHARTDYEHARSLDPREPLLIEALQRLDGPRPLTSSEAFQRLRRGVQRLTSGVRPAASA
jgi:O-antigen ligase